jgi:succinate dehydrogenase/fumarate reductase flavoprotein subunit
VKFYSENFIFVDKYGNRFANEGGIELHDFGRVFSHFDSHKVEFPRIPLYCIFDEVMRRRAPLCDNVSGYNRDKYKWSLDNSEEVRKGWILKGKTIAELAERISIDRASLENTVKRYNEFCKAGHDADFGRQKEYLLPLVNPPYYAVPLWPALYNTQGGPRRDREAKVLDMDGKPIPRLYAAGELGSIWGGLYEGGSNIAECLAFGRIAGRNGASEKPWI